jgi:hypothetical protein
VAIRKTPRTPPGGASKKNEGEADCAAWIVELGLHDVTDCCRLLSDHGHTGIMDADMNYTIDMYIHRYIYICIYIYVYIYIPNLCEILAEVP